MNNYWLCGGFTLCIRLHPSAVLWVFPLVCSAAMNDAYQVFLLLILYCITSDIMLIILYVYRSVILVYLDVNKLSARYVGYQADGVAYYVRVSLERYCTVVAPLVCGRMVNCHTPLTIHQGGDHNTVPLQRYTHAIGNTICLRTYLPGWKV
jgi:hypothetical protein